MRLAVVSAMLIALPVLAGCSARLMQITDIRADGGGSLTLELRLDPAAQRAIDLPRQLDDQTFRQFLESGGERWAAPGDPYSPMAQRTEADGTVVITAVRPLPTGTGDLADLRATLAVERPISQIVAATGRYWLAPAPGEGVSTSTHSVSTGDTTTATTAATTTTTTTATTTATTPTGEVQAGITGLPASVPLQTLLATGFRPASTGSGQQRAATFTLASRGGVGEVLNSVCNQASGRYVPTRADRALNTGLSLVYRWGMPSPIAQSSEGARISSKGAVAIWSMPYGACSLMEISSAGSDDERVINGLILGGALGFLLIVFAVRGFSRRRLSRRDFP